MLFARLAVAALLTLFACLDLPAAAELPFLTGRVVDNAELLSPAATEKITALLKAHDARTGEQVVVLTTPTLDGQSIEEYAEAVFRTWKLGHKGKDDGVLLVIVPKERRMRIEVGYGLEGRLTDVESNRITRNVIAPQLKAGDFDGGVEQGVLAILAHLRGEASAVADAQANSAQQSRASASGIQQPDLSLTERILFGAFIFGIIGLFTVIGVLTPGMGWFLYLFLIPFWAMFPMIVLGTQGALILLVIYLIAFPSAKLIVSRTAWYAKARKDIKTRGSTTIGGFVVGGASASSSSWSSSSSGSSSSSDSFSGDGGSSGGGGSSDSY